ncbi:hypothetical protein [Hugenholtzia roseola]|uniref:hypothetical protein n=1 Tax=Hugenholtzia roseola TaxID=1002 RepID=UPI0004107865|nr:hypothetical protein [Hugenholtzia roseola]
MNKYILKIDVQTNKVLSDSYTFVGDISFYREEEDGKPPYCYFLSKHLNDLEAPKELWARSLALVSIYNGVKNLSFNPTSELDSPSNMKIVSLHIWDDTFENITPNDSFNISQDKPFSDSLLNQDLTKGFGSVSQIIHLAKSKVDVLNLLLQLGNGLDWVSLYSVLDSIKYYSKQIDKKQFNKILKVSGFTNDNLKEFTGTANNYGILGVKGRHGVTGTKIPTSTMTITDAQNFILKISKTYLYEVYGWK